MVYNVIGLMSGSSLDGLDIAFVQLTETRGQWSFEILQAETVPFTDGWGGKLRNADERSVLEYVKMHTAFGHWMGEQVLAFIDRHHLDHKVAFIASHGHTLFHLPEEKTTVQIGDGAAIAALTGLPVISDLRALDVALGGQGAPIVPIGDRLLFGQYPYLLNLGGIANLTVQSRQDPVALDVCPANQVLNTLARREGVDYDEDGRMAASGKMLTDVLFQLNNDPWYQLPAPRSLSNEQAMKLVFPHLMESAHSVADMLHTCCQLIADQVAAAAARYGSGGGAMLVTGGGAFNIHLVHRLQEALEPLQIEVVVPDPAVVNFKEALVMALIGALRWREETNVLAAATGAARNSVGGALWMGQEG
jgi:anhydro-N-acetylmuramic acid kinase